MKLKLLLLFCMMGFSHANAQEALWLRYPAISPDGQFIAFSFKGDIYLISSAGGEAKAITRHAAHDFRPIWSRDSKTLAFASDRYGNMDVFTMPISGGEPVRVTSFSFGEMPQDFSLDDKEIIYTASIQDQVLNTQYPTGALPEVYSSPVNGGRMSQVITTPALNPKIIADANGYTMFYEDAKGYENTWRKHQQSAFARDIWMYQRNSGKHTKLTSFEGDDRNPAPSADGKTLYYLSEMSGSFNVYRLGLQGPSQAEALTRFEKHPVRFLSISNTGVLCFLFDGGIYTLVPGQQAKKLDIRIYTDQRSISQKAVPVQSGATEFSLAPNGKEIAFIFRGEVFVTAVNGSVTKRVTNTPEQERSVSWSPDSKKILYAAERNGSWNVYTSSIVRSQEPYFYASTLLKEETIVDSPAEEFQPEFSPDGKEIAYLEERTALKVYNIATKSSRTIYPANKNYSYSDGDQYFSWSPDSKWLLINFIQKDHWIGELGLISADGKSEVINLSRSGYNDYGGTWSMGGKVITWFSDRDGLKNHASWGAQSDVYGIFLTKEAFDRFKLSKEELELLKEIEEKNKKESDGKKEDKDKKDDKKENAEVKPLLIDWKGLQERKEKLTIHSADLSDALLSPDGEKLYYLASFEKGFDLWVHKIREKETKLLVKLGAAGGDLQFDKEGKNLFLLTGGNLQKIDPESGKAEAIMIKGEMTLNEPSERAYLFEHVWRQAKKKFYVTNLHGVDWDFYKKEYARFLPSIDNNWDFADLLSELLGELNASHTGAGYRSMGQRNDETASLGVIYDFQYRGKGIRIAEVLPMGPLDLKSGKVKTGTIIESIDGVSIEPGLDFWPLLNRKSGKNTLLGLYDELTKERWEETVKPGSLGTESYLMYHRWRERNEAMVEKLSQGRLGYVHVDEMSHYSYRDFYERVLGRHANKEALIVDTRFNGGGWLHDDLVTFLSGKKYVDLVPREVKIGFDPQRKWTKPSIVLVNEGNYSDAHFFPFVYRELGIGKIVGSPVPGTATAVWWETLMDPSLYFGIPQVGIVDNRGKYLENTQLVPDVVVYNSPESCAQGKDLQLEKSVEELLKELGSKK